MDKAIIFEMTRDHLALLGSMWVDWNDEAYEGAPMINVKRPYGDSDVINDVAEILGNYPQPYSHREREEYMDFDSDGEIKRVRTLDGRTLKFEDLERIHRQMALALQIVLVTQSFQTGTYIRNSYDINWKKIS